MHHLLTLRHAGDAAHAAVCVKAQGNRKTRMAHFKVGGQHDPSVAEVEGRAANQVAVVPQPGQGQYLLHLKPVGLGDRLRIPLAQVHDARRRPAAESGGDNEQVHPPFVVHPGNRVTQPGGAKAQVLPAHSVTGGAPAVAAAHQVGAGNLDIGRGFAGTGKPECHHRPGVAFGHDQQVASVRAGVTFWHGDMALPCAYQLRWGSRCSMHKRLGR